MIRRPLPMIALITAFSTAFAAGCSDSGSSSDPTRESAGNVPGRQQSDTAQQPGAAAPLSRRAAASSEDLALEGRQVYLSSCIACHNADPAKEGALGPSVAGASLELVVARVLRGEYPDGYVPKRDSAAMVAMPFLEKQIPALAAFLAASDR